MFAHAVTNNDKALSILWNPIVNSVQNLWSANRIMILLTFIFNRLFQFINQQLQSPSMIPVSQTFYIFKHKALRQSLSDDANIFKQQSSSFIVQALSQTCKAKTLAGRAANDKSGLAKFQSCGIQYLWPCHINNTFIDNSKFRLVGM